jgi:large subunit ribosomal protein L17
MTGIPNYAPTHLGGADNEERARAIERAEARAAAERAAEEEAERAARDAESAGESVVRRMAAAEAAAEEAEVDTAEAERTDPIGAARDAGTVERQAASEVQAGMRKRDSDAAVPTGAIAGEGTANCPPDFPIKGNRQSRIYHRPGQGSYASTVAEFCFASEEAAEAAGFRASRSRGQRAPP